MITKILTAVWTAVLVYTSVPSPVISTGSTPDMRDSWDHAVVLDIWAHAPTLTGFGTTYDAYNFAGSWYDNPDTWVQDDPNGQPLTPARCKAHPEYGCYQRDMGSWKKLVRPWSTTLGDMYAAIGPLLRKQIGWQMPTWHGIPEHKLRITSLVTGKSVVVWVADYCDCRQKHPNGPSSAWSLVDLSPQVWAALGAYKSGHTGPNVKGWNNRITVQFVP